MTMRSNLLFIALWSTSVIISPFVETLQNLSMPMISRAAESKPREARVSEEQIRQVIVAVKDEIYSRNLQKHYLDVGHRDIPIYIFDNFENNLIWMIYRLMPYGEVIRGAYVRKDGLVLLKGNPDDGFPASQGASMRTVFLDDDNLIKMKTTWKKHYFSVNLEPSQNDLRDARRREELRHKRE